MRPISSARRGALVEQPDELFVELVDAPPQIVDVLHAAGSTARRRRGDPHP